MPGHKNKKKEAGKMGPGGKSPKGGKPETGQDVMNKAEKATPLDPNAQKQMKKAPKGGKGKAKDQKEKEIPGKMKAVPKKKPGMYKKSMKAEGIYKRVMPTLMKHNPPKDKKQEKGTPDMGYGKPSVRFPGGKLKDSYGGGTNTDLLPSIKKGAKAAMSIFGASTPGMISRAISSAFGGSKKEKGK